MNARETVDLPLIIDDFDPGDRVYCIGRDLTATAFFGTVSAIQESSLTVSMDNGDKITVSLYLFQKTTGTRWRKCIPIQQVASGSILSYTGTDPETGEVVTVFSRVEKMLGDEIVLTDVDVNKTYSLYATEKNPLESLLRNWELEG